MTPLLKGPHTPGPPQVRNRTKAGGFPKKTLPPREREPSHGVWQLRVGRHGGYGAGFWLGRRSCRWPPGRFRGSVAGSSGRGRGKGHIEAGSSVPHGPQCWPSQGGRRSQGQWRGGRSLPRRHARLGIRARGIAQVTTGDAGGRFLGPSSRQSDAASAGKIADTFNEIISTNERMAQQLERGGRGGRQAGQDPPARQAGARATAPGARWRISVNTLIDDLLWPTARSHARDRRRGQGRSAADRQSRRRWPSTEGRVPALGQHRQHHDQAAFACSLRK